jgi:hypothetical protein
VVVALRIGGGTLGVLVAAGGGDDGGGSGGGALWAEAGPAASIMDEPAKSAAASDATRIRRQEIMAGTFRGQEGLSDDVLPVQFSFRRARNNIPTSEIFFQNLPEIPAFLIVATAAPAPR